MENIDQLRLIRDAQGDPALLALATVDLAFPSNPDAERNALRAALEAAAVPHWCDAAILAKLIDNSYTVSRSLWAQLKELPVVEPFPARGADAGNIHETSRLAIRRRLAEMQQARLIELSARLARAFETDMRPIGRIEWIYHLLLADPERGTSELEDLDRAWLGSARHEDLAALSEVLNELDTSQVLHGRALLRARLVVARRRAIVIGAASLSNLAGQLLQAAKGIDDARLAGDVYSFVGDVAQERGDLTAAEHAYAEDLAISERLAGLDPAKAAWQQDLAMAYAQVGGVAEERGDLTAAEQAYTRSLTIREQLAALDPANTTWQRDLAAAHNAIGDLALERGDLAAAEQAYTRSLTIREQLAALDPANTTWQRDLAITFTRIGGVAQERGDLATAEQAYAQDLAISEQLATLDPTNTTWQRDLAAAHTTIGAVALERGDLATAEQAYAQDLAICERLAALDPTNTAWQQNLAVAHTSIGDLAQERGDLAAAEQAYTRSLTICEQLATLDPANTTWQQNLAVAHAAIGDLAQARGCHPPR